LDRERSFIGEKDWPVQKKTQKSARSKEKLCLTSKKWILRKNKKPPGGSTTKADHQSKGTGDRERREKKKKNKGGPFVCESGLVKEKRGNGFLEKGRGEKHIQKEGEKIGASVGGDEVSDPGRGKSIRGKAQENNPAR